MTILKIEFDMHLCYSIPIIKVEFGTSIREDREYALIRPQHTAFKDTHSKIWLKINFVTQMISNIFNDTEQ